MTNKHRPQLASTGAERSIRYLRVSSRRQMDTDFDIDPDGNSVDTQRRVCQDKERSLKTVNVGEYVEPGNSAQSIEKRPVFRQMLERIAEQRDVEYVIVYNYSRAFRNRLDEAITKSMLAKLGVKIISAKENFGEGPMADAMQGVLAVFNELQVRMNGEDIKVKMANKVRNGGTIGRAPLGYNNVTRQIDGRKVNTIAVDEERRAYIVMAFELYATGHHTLESLREKLTEAGLRTRGSGRWPSGPISTEQLRGMLRDRYYIGRVSYQGVEYVGRHPALISDELFDRVQRVAEGQQGAGIRQRKHYHHLKGTVWCARCSSRFIVQRAVGRHGGEYYYFFCKGRQDGICDHPFIPVEVMEDAVIEHYGAAVWLPQDFRGEVRLLLEETASQELSLSNELREQLASRLKALDNKESYLLDLAAEEGWPKERLREKITAIRVERKDTERSLSEAGKQLETGRRIFTRALDLLDNPKRLYETADDLTRSVLNKVFFTRLKIDGKKVVSHEAKEPFSALEGAYRLQSRRSYRRAGAGSAQTATPVSAADYLLIAKRPALQAEDGAPELSLTDLLALAFGAKGSSKTVMVELRGLEPLTPTLPVWCATSCATAPCSARCPRHPRNITHPSDGPIREVAVPTARRRTPESISSATRPVGSAPRPPGCRPASAAPSATGRPAG